MRPSFEFCMMSFAHQIAKRSTCKRLAVGCVISSIDFRKIIAMGYNGNASGLHNGCDSEVPGACGCLHAEENAVINCDILRETPKIVFCTHLPCVMCLAPSTRVFSPSSIQRAYRRRYTGNMIRIVTRDGDLTVTPNHPILAAGRGWVRAEMLDKGDQLFNTRGDKIVGDSKSNNKDTHTAEEIFETFSVTRPLVRQPGRSYDFHGDGISNKDIDVVTINGPLKCNRKPCAGHFIEYPSFTGTDTGRMIFILPRSGKRGGRLAEASLLTDHRREFQPIVVIDTRFMKSECDNITIDTVLSRQTFERGACDVVSNNRSYRHIDTTLSKISSAELATFAQYAMRTKTIHDSSVRNTQRIANLRRRLTGLVALDDVLHVEKKHWSGHVFNLETANGWYVAENMVTHNCAKRLINLGGVAKVVFETPYRILDSRTMLQSQGITVTQWLGV